MKDDVEKDVDILYKIVKVFESKSSSNKDHSGAVKKILKEFEERVLKFTLSENKITSQTYKTLEILLFLNSKSSTDQISKLVKELPLQIFKQIKELESTQSSFISSNPDESGLSLNYHILTLILPKLENKNEFVQVLWNVQNYVLSRKKTTSCICE